MWGISRTSYLSASGSQARTVLFSSDMSFLLRFDHVWEAFGFYPTSARNAPHACLISSWAKAWCITSHTCSSGRGMPCTQVLATKPCRCRANIGYKASPWPEVKISKADNTWDGHCPSKVPFCVGEFPHKLFVRFGEPSPHGFVLKRHEFPPRVRPMFGKPLDSIPHRQEMRLTHAL